MFAGIARTVATVAILMVGVGGLAMMIVHGKPEPPTTEPEKAQSPSVVTAPVELQREFLDIDVDGVVVPRREIAVAAEVGGRVVTKAEACEAGKYVRKGEPLVEIDRRDYELEVLRLEKELKQADVSLTELDVEEKNTGELVALAKESLELQKREFARLEELSKQGDNYVTASQMDAERRNELTARNALVTLENQLRTVEARRGRLEAAQELVQAGLDKAKLNLSRTRITAPIDGMVVRDSVESDTYLAPGTVVALIEDVSQCDVRCNLRMDELYWIWNQAGETGGTAQEAMVRDYLLPPTPTTVVYKLGDRRYEWDGVLTRYDGIGVDETTRTVPCIVVVAEPNQVKEKVEGSVAARAVRGPRALVRGMYVELRIHVTPRTALLRVPVEAIRPGNRVWRVRENRLDTIPVRVISVMGDRAVIHAKQEASLIGEMDKTLRPGDEVVTTNLTATEEGMAVRVASESRQ
ncbi:MAG TPA: hypothetical protein VJL29_00560 [Thermoguttaceae bacterium]|nr:hypothetical protein [Thermoguttaceae bacterium]